MISFSCSCGRALKTRDDLAGKELTCPGCGKGVPVPGAAAAPAAPAAPPPTTAASPVFRVVPEAPAAPGPRRSSVLPVALALLAAASLAVNVVQALIRPSPPPLPAPPVPTDAGREEQDLRAALQDRDRQIDELRQKPRRPSESDRLDKLVKRLEELEEKRTGQEKEIERLSAERDELAARVSDLAQAKPAPPAPAPAVPAPPAEALEPPKPPPPVPSTLAELVERHTPAVTVVRTDKAAGAGFFVSADGFVLTNYHVVEGSQKITLEHLLGEPKARRKTVYPAQVCAIDLENDLALLRAAGADSVPILELASSETARVGDSVFAIGNPGVGDALLELSVSSGIISSLTRKIDDRRLLQTTTPINPGNSGGPLLTMSGRVIGIVTAKARDRENIGFAVPAELGRALLEGRDRDPVRVAGALADWETRHARAPKFKIDSAGAVNLGGSSLSQMIVEEENDRVLAIDPETNNLLVASLSQKKLVSKLFVGSEPVQIFRPPSSPKQWAWVCNKGSRNLVKIDLDKLSIVDTVSLSFPPVRIEASKNVFWVLSEIGRIYFVSMSDRKELHLAPTFEMYGNLPNAWSLAYDAKRDKMIGGGNNGIVEFDASKVVGFLGDLAGRTSMKLNEGPGLQKEMAKYYRTIPLWRPDVEYTFSRDPNVRPTPNVNFKPVPGYGLLLDEKSAKLYARRNCLRLEKLDQPIGSFKVPGYSLAEDASVRDFMSRTKMIDEILAASPDGKWVSTGTHLFGTDRFTAVKELPIPTFAAGFSRDSKTLYYFDWVNKQVARLPVD